jgi:hypothetical protein
MTDRNTAQPLRCRLLYGASHSQGVVEFAISLPVLLLLLFGIIDFSLLFSAWLLIQNMSRQAVRYAVTGTYNPSNCVAGCNDRSDQDQSRLQSIRHKARDYTAGLLIDNGAHQADPGYLKLTVCSGADDDEDGAVDYTTIYPQMGGSTYGDCLPRESPGDAGDPVVVIVDFNHPYITPFLNDVWPMVHLVSYHQGIVEQFRFSRLIALPPGIEVPTPTPSNTFTPTRTYTRTLSPTPSLTITPSLTPTNTLSPTPTATPNCSLFTLSNWTQTTVAGLPQINITITNSSLQDTSVVRLDFDWAAYYAAKSTQKLDKIYYISTLLTDTDTISPTIWASVSGPDLLAGTGAQINFNYKSADAGWPGDAPIGTFRLVVTLGNGCVVTKNPPNTPTPTKTFTQTLTPTITRTPTKTYTATKTLPPSMTFTITRTFTKTNTFTKTKTPTPSRTFTSGPSGTPTKTGTRTKTPTKTNTVPAQSVTITFTITKSPTPTRTDTLNPATPTRTRTKTPTPPTPTKTKTVCFDC